MMPLAVKLVGLATIVMAAISFVTPYRFFESGGWFDYEVLTSWSFISGFLYYGLIVSIAGLVIGIATLRGKIWVWKANIVFQILTTAIILAIFLERTFSREVAFIYPNEPFFIFYQIQKPLSLALSIFVVFLLRRPEARTFFNGSKFTKGNPSS